MSVDGGEEVWRCRIKSLSPKGEIKTAPAERAGAV